MALGVLATAAYTWNRSAEIDDLFLNGSTDLVRTAPNATDQLLHSGARMAAVLAPLVMVEAEPDPPNPWSPPGAQGSGSAYRFGKESRERIR